MKFHLPPQSFNFSNSNFLFKLVCTCWLITKLICYKLWLADRFFPLAPVNDSLLYVSSFVHTGLFWLSLLCMVLFWVFPGRKLAIILFLSEIISCLLDQNRWQPWEYQFICMLGAYLFLKDEKKRRLCWQIIMVGIYFFSGLSKCNGYFIHNVWSYLFLKQGAGIYHATPWLLRAGYLASLVEMGGAVALCFVRTRKAGVCLLCGMHLLNLVLLGPFILNINSVIWPWNILMPILLFSLFYKERIQFAKATWRPIYNLLILLAWWILPWLQLVGLWDNYLSGVLYSGKMEYLYICTDDLGASQRLSKCFEVTNDRLPCSTALSAYKWGMQEMNAAPYPEIRVYRTIAANWNKSFPGANNRFYLFRSGFTVSARPLP